MVLIIFLFSFLDKINYIWNSRFFFFYIFDFNKYNNCWREGGKGYSFFVERGGKTGFPSFHRTEFAGTHLRGVFRAGNKGCSDMVSASALCSMPVRGCCRALALFSSNFKPNLCVCVCECRFEKEKRRRMSQDGKAEEKEGEDRRNFLSFFFYKKYIYFSRFSNY